MGMDAYDIRLANVRALIDSDFEGNQAAFARAIGREPNYVSRWFTDTLHRKRIGERLAREIEDKLQLPGGHLDIPKPAADPLVAAEQPSQYGDDPWQRSVPVVGTAQLGDDGYWDELQHPPGAGDGFLRHATRDKNAYALRVKGDSMRPRIRPGEFVVVEPNTRIQPGDEVLVKTKDGRSMVKLLASHRNGLVELRSINEDHAPITLDESAIDAMHYVGAIVKAGLYRHI